MSILSVDNIQPIGSGTTVTFTSEVVVGSNIKIGTAGVITATSFVGSGANLTGISQVGGATGADFNDNVKVRFGASNDLQLFHATAGISTIMHFHSGGEPLHITSNGDIKFKVAADNTGGGGEDGLIIKSNGAVELYHNNNKKLESTSSGVTVTGGVTASSAAYSGEVDIADGQFLDFGNGGLKIRTNANNAYISEATSGKLEISASNLQLSNGGASQTYAYFTNGGSAKLYYAGLDTIETFHASTVGHSPSGGSDITGGGVKTIRTSSKNSNIGYYCYKDSDLVARLTNHGTGPEGIFQLYNQGVPKISMNGTNGTMILHGTAGYIQFGDTNSSSHQLDDYEQGDMNLTLTGSNGGSANYGYRTGHYTKIGNVCHVSGDIRFNGSWSGSTGDLYLGLPFTSEATGGCVGAGIVSEWNLSGSNWDNIMIKVDNNESVARFTAHSGSNNNTSTFQTNLFGNGRYLKFSFTYQTA
tara:strand:+ start:1716 stop:3134 length:1419 start_codon:yes stop_codon:yes gene_type:complete